MACYLCASCLGPARVLKECGEAVREYGDEALERSRVLLVRGAEPCASSPEVMVCVCVCVQLQRGTAALVSPDADACVRRGIFFSPSAASGSSTQVALAAPSLVHAS